MSELIEYNLPIPNGWEIINFNDTYSSVTLNKIKIKQKDYLTKGNYPVVDQGQELIGGYFDNIQYLLKEEPPFLVFGDHTKVKKYINFKFVAGADGVKVLKPNKHINPKLLFFFLHCFKIPDRGYARHFQFLNNAEFPLPPFAEQQRIVAKIEELFSELDKGIETLKTAQQRLKVYRQAVLKYAFEGKLTNPNVKEGELPEGWLKNNVKQIADSIQYGYTESSSKEQVGPKFLRITDIQDNKVNWADVPYCRIKEEEKAKYLLQSGDLVFARTGATVGKSFLIRGSVPESVFASYLIRVRFPKHISDVYVWYFFQSPVYWKQIIDKSVGTGQPNVNGTRLGELEVVFPESIEEQLKIVEEIESRLSVFDKIEESIEQGLQQSEALRQSILKKAFEGKLVLQDLNDEPASVLLERIKAERQKIQPEKKIKTKKVKA